MKKICMIGPFPPPINGNSKAYDIIYKSEEINKYFELYKIDLNQLYVNKESGKLNASKVLGVVKIWAKIKEISKYGIDAYYLSISQSLIGCIRDMMFILLIRKSKYHSKIILHLHGGGFRSLYARLNGLGKKIIKYAYSNCDIAIVLSKSLTKMFDGIIPEEKIRVIKNCVENDVLISDKQFTDKLFRFPLKKEFKILYLSNMIKSKGYLDLLFAAKQCVEEFSNIKFFFAGDFKKNDDRIEFYSEINNLGLEKQVEYLGIVEDEKKKKLLYDCDVFILPTYYPYEGQPISILEAMSAGMPIITTDQGGIRDIVKHEENGFIVPAQNHNAIYNALKRLLRDDKNVYQNMMKSNRTAIIEIHTENQYIGRIRDIYTEVTSNTD